MTLASMTGFARASGTIDGVHWFWEVKSVNGKALDLRCRLPQGFDGLEPALRQASAEVLKRGSLQVSLTVTGLSTGETVRLNTLILDQILAAGEELRARIGGEPLRADMILSLRGVLDMAGEEADEATVDRRNGAMLASFREALRGLVSARREEGARLGQLLGQQVSRIELLAGEARDDSARFPEAIRARLAEQVARLMEVGSAFDPQRLHQEAVLLATRADIQEELDRLFSHVAAARALLSSGEAVGRKFDFLAQEFNREANTLCSKASGQNLTAIGLELKTVIDQMREQVQNIE